MSKEDKLKDLRDNIDSVDEKILDLLNERTGYVLDVGKVKGEHNAEFYVPSRERAIYEKLTKANKGPFPNNALKSVYREIISASLSLEKPLSIAFLGPQATYTHEACIKHFGFSGDFVPKKDITDIFTEVEKGKAEFGVVPIENTTEGVVNHTLDMFVDSPLKISAEIMLEINHSLLNKSGKMEDIKEVASYPNALGQCKNWLKENLPKAILKDVSSTAHAAQLASENKDIAAIASPASASLYDLMPVAEKIEDSASNFTRFLIIGNKESEKTGNDKTSLMLAIKDSPGALYQMLTPFADSDINLTKIESRPLKKKAWEYVFFIDMLGHAEDEKIKEAIDKVTESVAFLKVLGSYPRSI